MTEPILEIRNLTRRFPVKRTGRGPWSQGRTSWLHAVDGVEFAIAPGETVGLVGESGCGKSTLVRLITRLLDLTSGRISFAGKDIGSIPARRFARSPQRARIQMVFQDAGESLNPRFTAARVIADPLLRLSQVRGSALAARAREAALLAGLPDELLGRFPHQLSGGQKARVGIARAIAVEPQLMILDEPTAALDVSVQVVILQLLDGLKRRLGMSYLFVSHDLNVVRLLCDRVLVMYLGKIVESGPVEAVFGSPAHPYTKALVAAIPSLDQRGVKRLRLSGEARSPIDPDPNTCRFYGRCPKGQSNCATAMPELRPLGGGRSVACHYPETAAAEATREAPAASSNLLPFQIPHPAS
jgi:oligopeptide/dipeptide ABC transporter ATP-binding protein